MNTLTKRRCSKCKEFKPLSEFHKGKGPLGLRTECKTCHKKDVHDWAERNREKKRATGRKYRTEHLEQENTRAKTWAAAHPERKREIAQRWNANHPEYVREHSKIQSRRQRATPKGQVRNNITRGIHRSLTKGVKASRSWESIVGYTLDQLMGHLEEQFTPEMTWENYGSYWHVDHKIPISVFNFTCPEDIDFQRCWSLSNLQPLEKITNIKKGNKLDGPFQPSLLI